MRPAQAEATRFGHLHRRHSLGVVCHVRLRHYRVSFCGDGNDAMCAPPRRRVLPFKPLLYSNASAELQIRANLEKDVVGQVRVDEGAEFPRVQKVICVLDPLHGSLVRRFALRAPSFDLVVTDIRR
jgi:hypothetical protein